MSILVAFELHYFQELFNWWHSHFKMPRLENVTLYFTLFKILIGLLSSGLTHSKHLPILFFTGFHLVLTLAGPQYLCQFSGLYSLLSD